MLVLACFATDAPWHQVSRSDSVTIFRRPHSETTMTETLSVGIVDAPPWVVKNALDDYQPKIGQMPYLAEARVLKRDDRGVVIYNRASPPLVADRDYTIVMYDASFVRADGTVVYVSRWRTANEEGPPARDGVVRIDKIEGYWQLEPIDGGKRTRATYLLIASPGGNLPQSIADWGTNTGMVGVFDALRTRSRVPIYAKAPPPPPTRRE